MFPIIAYMHYAFRKNEAFGTTAMFSKLKHFGPAIKQFAGSMLKFMKYNGQDGGAARRCCDSMRFSSVFCVLQCRPGGLPADEISFQNI